MKLAIIGKKVTWIGNDGHFVANPNYGKSKKTSMRESKKTVMVRIEMSLSFVEFVVNGFNFFQAFC